MTNPACARPLWFRVGRIRGFTSPSTGPDHTSEEEEKDWVYRNLHVGLVETEKRRLQQSADPRGATCDRAGFTTAQISSWLMSPKLDGKPVS